MKVNVNVSKYFNEETILFKVYMFCIRPQLINYLFKARLRIDLKGL